MKRFVHRAAGFFLLTSLFAVIYTQSPLYTSNQNQYFLHGLAQAGVGYLAEDWLANTLDPTPVFSSLVEWTYRLTHWETLYYIIYALLMGIYAASAIGIVEHIFPLRNNARGWKSTRFLVFLALFLLVHSAAWRFALSRGLGDNWSFVLEDGVADQRLLGLVLQPSAFGVLLALSIYLFLKDRPYWAVLSAALAASVHPTYLLSAGALTAGFLVTRLLALRQNTTTPDAITANGQQKKSALRRPPRWPVRIMTALLPGFLALLAVLPILAYVYLNFGDTPPETTAQAQDILVHYRIPHHALVSWWFDATAIVKLTLMLSALILVRKQRLFWVLGIPFVIAATLTLAQVISGSNFLALLFPWRISVFLTPLSTTLILAWLVQQVTAWLEKRATSTNWGNRASVAYPAPTSQQIKPNGVMGTVLRTSSLALIALLVMAGLARIILDFQRKAQSPENPMLDFVAANHQAGEIYLTPIKMQEFHLLAKSPQYVDFKAIPYQDGDVLEWYRRIRLADRFYKQSDCAMLRQFVTNESITHVILPQEIFDGSCPDLNPVYEDEAYGVYRLELH